MMKKQVDEMKKIMELSKSPMLGASSGAQRQNMSGSQVSPFGMRKPTTDQAEIAVRNNKLNS